MFTVVSDAVIEDEGLKELYIDPYPSGMFGAMSDAGMSLPQRGQVCIPVRVRRSSTAGVG